MLILSSDIAGTSHGYSPSFKVGARTAQSLRTPYSVMNPSDEEVDLLTAQTSTLGITRIHRSSDWAYQSSDPFLNPSAAQMPSLEYRERLRSRIPTELNMTSRPLPRSMPLELLQSSSFASPPSGFGFDPASFSRRDDASQVVLDDTIDSRRRQSQDSYFSQSDFPITRSYTEYDTEPHSRRDGEIGRGTPRHHTRRRPFNQDEFDGPSQLLPLPLPQQEAARAQDLIALPIHLNIQEQEGIFQRLNEILSHCAYHFVAKYQFPIPLERDKPRVRIAADRDWTEWAYLLKRLATKRRIPSRVLFDNQIKQLVTTLENSIVARQSRDPKVRTLKDDRYILQLVSASTQVAKILMDSYAMEQLHNLYIDTESLILQRRARASVMGIQ